MKIIVQILLFNICFSHSFAQTERSVLNDQLKVKQVKGVYDRTKKTFYCKSIDSANLYVEHKYQVEKYLGNTGIVKYNYTNTKSNQGGGFYFYGVIDTTGKVIVPCAFDELKLISIYLPKIENEKKTYEEINNLSYFIFKTFDSTGIVSANNRRVLQIPLKGTYISSMVDSGQRSMNYCRIFIDHHFGLFSLALEKVVVPAKYTTIGVYDNYAICKEGNEYIAYNCKTGAPSEKFERIWRLNMNGPFLIQYKNKKLYACNDILDPVKTGNNEINHDSILAYQDHFLIVRSKDKCALINESGKEIIPFIYNDIYFLDKKLLLVKQNGLWAISNYQHELLSGFEFIDVDKQNRVNFQNLITFSGIDTSSQKFHAAITDPKAPEYGVPEFDSPLSMGHLDSDILEGFIDRAVNKIIDGLNSNIMSDYSESSPFKTYVLLKNDGSHLITFYETGSNLKIDSLKWDNIFRVPELYDYSYQIGVQRGKKFGYYDKEKEVKKYLKYDGVYFDPKAFWTVGGSHGSAFVIVRKKNVYYRFFPERTAWWKRPFTPYNYPLTYDGRPKWVKYMKLTEFIKKRNGIK